MAYIGRGIDNISQIEVLDLITFTNSAGPYNILKGAVAFIPSTVNSLLIEVDGIIQAPASYTVDGSTITFGVSMPSTSTMNSMIHFGTGLITTPADGSVTAAKIASDAVTTAKILDNNVTVAKLPTTLNISGNTVTLPASVSGLGTGITNAQLAGSIDVTAKITGVVPTANLGSGSASASTYLAGNQAYQTITAYNDDALQNDIATLALHQATNSNAAKYNLTNTNVDVYQDSTGIASLTDCVRDTSGEYVSTISTSVGEFTSDGDTLLLLHADGADASTTITDSSSNGYTMTANGDAQLDTAQKKYGTASCLFDGSGDYISNTSTDWDSRFATSDFTIEMWIRGANLVGNRMLISKGGEGFVSVDYQGWSFVKNSEDKLILKCINSTPTNIVRQSTAALSFSTDTWYHIALARDVDDAYYMYVDGVSQAVTAFEGTAATTFDGGTRDLEIGRSSDGGAYFGGWIDELRVSSSCRYPGGTTFTPNEITTVNATGNYVSTATVANASVSKVGIVMTYKNESGTNTLNTDIVAQVSADGGSNYSTVTLAAAGTFSTGVLQAVANDVSVTAGTSIQYKISFANQASGSKEARITGASLIY